MRLLSLSLLAVLALFSSACNQENTETESAEEFTEAMAKEHAGDTPTGNSVAWLEPATEVEGEPVSYTTIDGTGITGYLARPKSQESSSTGVIVIHEWWGLNDNIRAMARRIAGDGYVALAVDLYNGNVAGTSDSAKILMGEAMQNKDQAIANLKDGIAYLKAQGATKIGVIGWCFGGAWSLQTALNFPDDIDATVIYYGHLVNDPDMLAKLDMPLLGIFGEEDGGIPVAQVREFESTLDSLGKQHTIQIYPNANHAFANPSGERYNAEAAVDAWTKTTAFLSEHLK